MHECTNPDCGASVDAMHVEENPIYKVTIGGAVAEEIAEALLFSAYTSSLVSGSLLLRISPIVFYARLDDRHAIELAQEKDVECVRARADWSI